MEKKSDPAGKCCGHTSKLRSPSLLFPPGRFLMSTAPAEVKDLREGEELLICMEGDDVEGEERLADTPSS